MAAAQHIQQLRQQAHQALAAALPDWPATLQAAQDHAGCRLALSAVVMAMLALRPAHPKPAHPTRPAGAGANLMRLALRPPPTHDRRRAAAGDVDDDHPTTHREDTPQ